MIGNADGGAARELLPASDETGYPTSLRSGTQSIALNVNRSWIAIARGDKGVQRLDMGDAMSTLPDLEPDGRFVAYAWNHGGAGEVYVRSIEDRQIVRQISVDGGLEPFWCRSGELFYRKADSWMSVRIRTTPELQWEPAQPAFRTDFVDTPGRSYDVSSDGQRLLVVKRALPDTRNRITLVTSWTARLGR